MMYKKLYGVKIIVVVIALVAGSVAGTLTSLPVVAANFSSQPSQDVKPTPVFPVNQNGQTYGSLMDVNTPGQEPDLVKAVGVDGTLGYVKFVDMQGKLPKNPEEAIAIQNSRLKEGPKTIPLYDVDGKTIIGKFKIGNAEAFLIPEGSKPEDIIKELRK